MIMFEDFKSWKRGTIARRRRRRSLKIMYEGLENWKGGTRMSRTLVEIGSLGYWFFELSRIL